MATHSTHSALPGCCDVFACSDVRDGGQSSSLDLDPFSSKPPLSVCGSRDDFSQYGTTATLLSNSQSVIKPIERVVSRAQTLYSAGAYVHQYESQGVERDHIEGAMTAMEHVLLNYQNI